MVRGLFLSILFVACVVVASDPLNGGDSQKREVGSDGLMAWQHVYSVLTSPRCINCHTATDYPQQGDDRHRHFANVVRGTDGTGVAAPQCASCHQEANVRGADGKGAAALQCVSCHQEANADTTGVPGARGWHLAPLAMKWQDDNDRILSSADVCRALKDRAKNGDRDGKGLLEHHAEEPLVLWAFQPGRGIDGKPRTLPPLTHDQFVEATRNWVDAGMPCPAVP